MKTLLSMAAFITMLVSCSENKERYIDLSTGQPVEVKKDEITGAMINKETNNPLYIYIDTKSNDTIYARTGKVINGHILKGDDQKYVFDEDEKLKIHESGAVEYKDGDYKMEIEKDGDTKTKNGDKKIKTDEKTGERKVKKD